MPGRLAAWKPQANLVGISDGVCQMGFGPRGGLQRGNAEGTLLCGSPDVFVSVQIDWSCQSDQHDYWQGPM